MADATVPQAPAAKPKKEKKVYQEVFTDEASAKAEAEKREKGPRRAFKCEHGGKSIFVVANNEGRAGGVAFQQIGGKVSEIGKEAKAKVATPTDVMALLSNMPEEERKKVIAQIEALKNAPKTPTPAPAPAKK